MGSWSDVLAAYKRSPKLTAALLGLFLVSVAVLVFHALYFDFINDDAFISFRYSHNLAHHGQLVYNLGDPVEGYTNFLWTVIIALVIKFGGDPVLWSKLLGIACSGGTLLVLFGFAQRLRFGNSGDKSDQNGLERPSLATLVAPFLLAMTSTFACWTEGGLETALFTFLLTWTVTLYLTEELTIRKIPFSAIVLAFAAMTRPEGVLIFVLIGAHMVVSDWIQRRKFMPQARRWIFVGVFLGLYLPYWLWRFNYYGYLFPNTYYLKGSQPSWEAGLRYFATFLQQTPVWLVVLAAFVPWRARRFKILYMTLLAAIALPYLFHVIRVGGDFMGLHRFYMPLLPILYFPIQAGVDGFCVLIKRAKPLNWRSLAASTAGVLVLAGVFAFHNVRLTEESLKVGSQNGIDSIGWLKKFAAQCSAIGIYMRETYPEDTTMVATAAGAMTYYSRFKTLDWLGLNDEYIAHNVKPSRDRPGHRVLAPESYIFDWDPDLIVRYPRRSRKTPGVSPRPNKNGYLVETARVPNLIPPLWTFERKPDLKTKVALTQAPPK